MAKRKVIDLNDHLFALIERLGNEKLRGDALKEEIARSSAVCGVADRVIKSGDLMLRARIAADNTVMGDKILPAIMGENFGPESDTQKQ